ncbi:hypothetical protein VNI00_013333 [Paramarasmius palmivorus]|uniref:Cytochrome P450 n=1 Tax=Paramarasmius palmivorus TaxID=297713 RepID=A0AAW0C1N1_9AGAR
MFMVNLQPLAADYASVFISLLILLAWLFPRILKIGRRELFLPPGPPTIPILGNLHIFPLESTHLKFTEWARQYGEVISLKIGPRTAIVINSMEAAKELMEKRSTSTSDRPKNHMAEKVTRGQNMAIISYSDTWRVLRKAAHALLTPKAVEAHLPIQRAEACQVMNDFLNDPEDFFKHIGRYSNSVIMSILFGKRCPRYESVESEAFFRIADGWNRALSPTVPPVDLLPFLDYLPEKIAWWNTLANDVRQMQRKLYFGLVDECEARMKRGENNGSFMENLLLRQKELGLDRELVGYAIRHLSAQVSSTLSYRYLGGVLLEGGTETTASFLRRLVLFLAAFPDAQRKAQEEMDRVVGHERLPMLQDINDLPYIQALIQEAHRFYPVAPLALPHGASADEEYHGYVIPKDATIFVNTYAIFHNPDYFENPEAFTPERYLNSEFGTKPGADVSAFRNNVAFGYGRRICPGISLAENSLALNTMNFVWAFNFKPPKDDTGNEIPMSHDIYEKKGILPITLPFKCRIESRSTNVAEIIEREFRDATETFVKFEGDLAPEDRLWVDNLRKM